MVNPSIFKAYDIRGLYPSEINKDAAFSIGQAYIIYTGASRVVVGRDMRESSPELFDALTDGITRAGADVIDVGLVATPEFYFAVAESDYDGGIMVTASHNPSQYNGFKMARSDAMPIGAETGLEEIEKLALLGEKRNKPVGQILETDILNEYLDKVFSLVKPAEINPNLQAVVDTGNGMAGVIEGELWKRLKNKMKPIHFELDGRFPNHEPDPSKPENLKDVSERVRQTKASLGISFDGDGDRVGFVDERGEQVRNDLILALLGREILKQKPGAKILSALGSSRAVEEEVRRLGGEHETTRVGHAFIKKQMRDSGAVLAGEVSGHFYFQDFYGVECSDLAMLYVLKIISDSGKKFSALVAPLQKYFHSGELNFTVSDKDKVMKFVEEKYAPQASAISRLDGLKFDFIDGKTGEFSWWFNIRPSNTEPLLRLNIEARSRELLEVCRNDLTKLVFSV